jgi:hypothetical protein
LKRFAARLFAALAFFLSADSQARAEFVAGGWHFMFNPSINPSIVFADDPSQGALIFYSNGRSGSFDGQAYHINAGIVQPGAFNATFTNTPYRIDVSVTDSSGLGGKLQFPGVFNGTLSFNGPGLSTTLAGPQSLLLGNQLYTVQIDPFTVVEPDYPSATPITATVTVKTVSDVPEPSTLALAGLCLALGGAGLWWKRLRGCGLAGSPPCPAGGLFALEPHLLTPIDAGQN